MPKNGGVFHAGELRGVPFTPLFERSPINALSAIIRNHMAYNRGSWKQHQVLSHL